MLLWAWLPTILFTVCHYASSPHLHWLHDVLRRMYYLPILLAAFACGLRGGLLLAIVVTLAYSPHAFTHWLHMDPARTLEKVLEVVLYLVVGGVSGMLVDRERRRQRELADSAASLREALQEQERTAEQLIRTGRLAALGELVAGIAHEIKNPLHALRGTAEIVDRDVPLDSPRRSMWELHMKEIDRLGHVAERFLSFARPTAPQSQPIDLREAIRRAAELIGGQARQEGITVEVAPLGEALITVNADPQQLTQVLLNITLNAVQSMTEGIGSRLSLAIKRESRGESAYAVVAIENDGPPIPPADLERIFDPFVTTKAGGVGLGLSVASRIIEQHGGFIRASNLGEDRGTAFSVYLPVLANE